ncbi:hypothetical protein THRCLA_04340 [Thraustotheca clavata]|uniref:Uncharacterized protein n=1 Tax=Thraustotheca clavata TaxID=74557 RepID=A0A1V9ZZB4_9STRA|nr:hypothetical protein THRCLA_04340 [Thraustotheca clavata]
MANYDKWNRILRELEEDEEEAVQEQKPAESEKTHRISNKPHQLREDIQEASKEIHRLEQDLSEYDNLSSLLGDLPKKLEHEIMVPLGQQAFVPGKIVHSNEIIAHIGGDHYVKKSAVETQDMIARRQKNITKRIECQKEWLKSVHDKLNDVDNVLNLKKIYEDENIQEIKESEDDSNRWLQSSDATPEDFEEYFEIENEEARKAQTNDCWSWEEAMQRIEELEKDEDDEGKQDYFVDPKAVKAENFKQQGNVAFASANYQTAMEKYSKAIALQPSSHTLNGNRSAAYFHLRRFDLALEDADKAIALDAKWAKGYFRRGQALGELGRYEDAAIAFEKASALKPSDKTSATQATLMRSKLQQQLDLEKNMVQSKSFSGRVLERQTAHASAASEPQVVEQPPKRVSRFKAMRQGQTFN